MAIGWGQERHGCTIGGVLVGTARWLAVILVSVPCLGQPTAEREIDTQQAGPIEEVIVRAPRSLRSMQREVERAEDRAFEMFNELNDDDDYDIVCHRELPTGSNISYRNCRARFVDRLLRESTEEAFSFGNPVPLPLQQIANQMTILAEKVEALARENPQFLDATIEVELRKDDYASALEARRGP